MAKKYLVPIDMNGLEIQNFKAHNLATAPTGSDGKVYFNTADKKLYYYNGTSWVALTANTNVPKTTTTPKMDGTAAIGSETKYAAGDHVHPTDTSRAPLASPALTGTPTAPTASAGTNTTQIATTAFVKAAVDAHSAFGNVKVGSTTIAADSKTDTLELVAGSNVTLTPDATNDKVTIAATDTTYSEATTSAAGLMSASDKSKLNGIASGAEVNQNAFSNVTIGSTTIAADGKTDTLTLVAGSNVTLTPDATNDKVTIAATDTTYSEATTSAAGLMSASDKTKLNGIASGAEVNVQSDWNQTTTTADDYIKNKPTLGQAAAKNVDTSIGSSSSTNLPTTNAVKDYVSTQVGAVDAMRFKGTIGSGGTITTLPTSGVKVGDTYRVITAGTYAGQTCEIGDLIIATATTPTWTVAQTNIDGAITSISGTAPISVSGSGSSRTIAISAASGSAAGSMSSTHYTKLEGIASGAEVNQNAFSNVKVGSTTVAADAKTDTLELAGTAPITLTPDSTNDKVTFSISAASGSAAGSMSSAHYTKLEGIASGAEVNQNAFSNVKVGSTTVAADSKTDTLELVGGNVTVTPDATNDKVTFDLATSGVSAGTYSGGFDSKNEYFYVPYFTVDAYGRITSASSTSTPSAMPKATWTTNGFIESDVYRNLDVAYIIRSRDAQVTLSAGDTSVTYTAGGAGVRTMNDGPTAATNLLDSVHAFDVTTHEEVVVDVNCGVPTYNSSTAKYDTTFTFSIAEAYANDIEIRITWHNDSQPM